MKTEADPPVEIGENSGWAWANSMDSVRERKAKTKNSRRSTKWLEVAIIAYREVSTTALRETCVRVRGRDEREGEREESTRERGNEGGGG